MSQAQCARSTEGYVFTWPDLPFTVKLSRLRDSSRGTTAEIECLYSNGTGKAKTLTHQSLNLLTSKTKLAKELAGKQDAPWLSMLEQVAVLAIRASRQGDPIESLQPTAESQPAWFVLNPLLYQQNSTVLYGPGDSLKSFFALYCTLLLANGQCGPNLSVAPTPWKVLFLDWEMSADDVRGRVKLLQTGNPALQEAPDYRRCFRPLADDLTELKKVVGDGEYDVLVLDSLAMAAGGQELERADAALRFNAALRALNCTSLIIGHTPKPQEDQKERSLYGSVFFHNLCRVSWECRREGDVLGLYQRKNNLGAKHDSLGFTLVVTDEAATITEADLMDEPTLAQGLPLKDRLYTYLTEQPGQTPKELARAMESKEPTIRTTLNRWKALFQSLDGKWDALPTR